MLRDNNNNSYAWCSRYNICSAWLLDIRISTCYNYDEWQEALIKYFSNQNVSLSRWLSMEKTSGSVTHMTNVQCEPDYDLTLILIQQAHHLIQLLQCHR